jgi:pimeloyl-ACP methyl ester carboxylesterase
MKSHWFHLMPYKYLPDDFQQKHKSVWVDVPSELYDPEGPLGQMLLQQIQASEMVLERHRNLASTGKFLWPIPDKGLKKRIHRIQQPTLIIWGTSDKLIPPAYGEAFLKAIHGAQLVTLPKSGHMPMLEEQEAFVQTVTTFLST